MIKIVKIILWEYYRDIFYRYVIVIDIELVVIRYWLNSKFIKYYDK